MFKQKLDKFLSSNVSASNVDEMGYNKFCTNTFYESVPAWVRSKLKKDEVTIIDLEEELEDYLIIDKKDVCQTQDCNGGYLNDYLEVVIINPYKNKLVQLTFITGVCTYPYYFMGTNIKRSHTIDHQIIQKFIETHDNPYEFLPVVFRLGGLFRNLMKEGYPVRIKMEKEYDVNHGYHIIDDYYGYVLAQSFVFCELFLIPKNVYDEKEDIKTMMIWGDSDEDSEVEALEWSEHVNGKYKDIDAHCQMEGYYNYENMCKCYCEEELVPEEFPSFIREFYLSLLVDKNQRNLNNSVVEPLLVL